MAQCLRFELLLKSLQIVNVNVRDSPVVKVRVRPMQQLIALTGDCFRSPCCIRGCRPNKKVNKMFASPINQRRYWAVIQIIKATTNQRKSLTRKIDNRRSKIELRIQPRLNCVPVGRRDVGEMVR